MAYFAGVIVGNSCCLAVLPASHAARESRIVAGLFLLLFRVSIHIFAIVRDANSNYFSYADIETSNFIVNNGVIVVCARSS